jgi:hypothetical protein
MAHGEVLGLHFRPEGFDAGTDLHGFEAAGMEAAAGRGIDRAGNVSLQDDPLFLLVRVQYRNGGHERLGVRMEAWSKLLFGGQLDDLAST